MRNALLLSLSLSLAALTGCASTGPAAPAQPPPPPAAPPAAEPPPQPAPEATPAPPAEPLAIPAGLREENLASLVSPTLDENAGLPAAPKGIEAAPKSCDAYAKRKPDKAPACEDRQAALTALDHALTLTDPAKQDAALAGLEACAGLPAGLVRALRADFAPASCGDAIVEPFLATRPKNVPVAVKHTLVGHVLAARLTRAGGGLPAPKSGKQTREQVLEHIKGPVVKWLQTHSFAVEDSANAGSKLGSYGRALVALEAGMADLRIVESARQVPIPAEIKADAELRNIYYGELDQALEPRKLRGRDGVLVALLEFAQLGVLSDPRVDRARAQLTKLYRGRGIDALDSLLLPPLSPSKPSTLEERLASRLPTFYASLLLDGSKATSPTMLRALLDRGVFPAARQALKGEGLSPELRSLAARARVESGKAYWRGVDFDEALRLLSPSNAQSRDDDRFLVAISLAARSGPESAAALMRGGVQFSPAEVRSLDAFATERPTSPLTPLASFDAALLLSKVPRVSPSAAYEREIARRFTEVAGKLGDSKARDLARRLAGDHEDVAKFIEQSAAK